MARPSSVVSTWKPLLEAWLNDREEEFRSSPSRAPSLPSTSDKAINVQEVARQLGCSRSYLYDYIELSSLLDHFAEGQGLLPMGSRTPTAGDKAVKDRMAMISKSAKVDAQAAVEAKAALLDSLRRNVELVAEVDQLRLENASLRDQVQLMHQGIKVQVR